MIRDSLWAKTAPEGKASERREGTIYKQKNCENVKCGPETQFSGFALECVTRSFLIVALLETCQTNVDFNTNLD